jgi:hypothetical protein
MMMVVMHDACLGTRASQTLQDRHAGTDTSDGGGMMGAIVPSRGAAVGEARLGCYQYSHLPGAADFRLVFTVPKALKSVHQ